MINSENDIMTLLEISNYLKVSKKTVFRMLQKNKITGFKVGKQWRFLKPVVDDWLTNKMQILPENNLVKVINTSKDAILLTDLISEKRIIHDLKNGSKEKILEQLVEPLYKQKLIKNREDYLQKLILREKLISTAIGHGVAFPHLRNPLENKIKKDAIVLGICTKGTNFKSLDGKKTYLFALIATNSEVTHLQLLAEASLLFRDRKIVKEIIYSENTTQVMDILKEVDQRIKINRGDNQ